jgi:hypothetical protein
MKKTDVIKFFGSVTATAKALGVKGQAVSMWGEAIPMRRAYQVERLSDGKLKAEEPANSH